MKLGPLLYAGVGDKVYQLLSTASLYNEYSINSQKKKIVFCCENDVNCANDLISFLVKTNELISKVYHDIELIPISNNVIIDKMKSNSNPFDNSNASIVHYENDLFYMNCWPGVLKNIGELRERCQTWPQLYSNYVGVNYLDDFKSRKINANKNIKIMISSSANSVKITGEKVNLFIKHTLGEFCNIGAIYNNYPSVVGRFDTNNRALTNAIGAEKIKKLFNDSSPHIKDVDSNLNDLLSLLNSVDVLISVRSGLTDIAAILGIRCITLYPDLGAAEFYKMSKNEIISEKYLNYGLIVSEL